MISQQPHQIDQPDFSKLPQEARIPLLNILFKSIEVCLQTFWNDMNSRNPEIASYKEKIRERFYNAEFSALFRTTVLRGIYAGYFIIQDESSNPLDLLFPKKKKGLERQEDLGISLVGSRDRFLVVECKKLHSKKDKQYVSGNTGGICRFKREHHGADMDTACIIGFMEIEDFSYWHALVNQWIEDECSKTSDLKWGNKEDEKLSSFQIEKPELIKCISRNARIKKPPIELHHFWVKVY